MKYTLSFIFLVSILVPLRLSAQVQGRILDGETGEPIPYAHAYLQVAGQGTASNSNGYFRLVIPDKRDTLRVTSIGYEPFILPVTQSSDVPATIRLNPSTTMLDEVIINASGPDAGEIMRKAIARYFANYGIDDYHLKTFMRTTMQSEDKYVHLRESDGWVYDGGAPAWKAVCTRKNISWTQFTVQDEVRISDQKYIPRFQAYNPAFLNSYALIWEPQNYDYILESTQVVDRDDFFYTIRAIPARKGKLKKKSGSTWFNLMDRTYIIRAKDYAVLEVKMGERFPKKRDGIKTSEKFGYKRKNYLDSAYFLIKYDITPSGIYRPYYTRRYYEYTDLGYNDYTIPPLDVKVDYEMFFSAYDTSNCTLEDLKKRYHSYRPYERTKAWVTLVHDNDSTSGFTRPILSGYPSLFQLNYGYVVWGKPTYRPEYWSRREKTIPPYQDKEKLFTDLASFRPLAEQFADFTPRSEDTAKRMLELYGDDPYVREVMERQIATMKSRYERFFDPEVDY